VKIDAPTLTAIGSLVASLASVGAVISSFLNRKKIQEVHVGINSRMDELLRQKGIASRAQGRQEGLAERLEMISNAFIQKFAQAIARTEGFYVANSVPQRARNPGDLANGDIGNGVIQTSGPAGAGITIYSNDIDGWNDLYLKLRRMLSGASEVYTLDLSIEQVGEKWSDTPTWGQDVAEILGVPATTTLAELAAADLKSQGLENAT
jgi:hypothetical protein